MAASISPEQAAAALAEAEQARRAMREVVRAHRGHLHLWIWGAVWVAMPLAAHIGGERAARFFPAISAVGAVLSAFVGFTQSRQIRLPVNGRFLGMFAALLGFAALFPFVLGVQPTVRGVYAYVCLVAMQAYIVAGLWTDTYLLWAGLLITALVLAGVFLFPGIFWLWMAVFGGGTLIATGFYVRYFWRSADA
jgi:hypothetical protein